MSQSPSDEQLIAYLSGNLDRIEAEQLRGRLAVDPVAARRLQRFQTLLDTMRGDDSVDPPPATMAAAKQLFRERAAASRPTSWLDNLRQIIATLTYDSRKTPALAGLRGAAGMVALVFEAGDAEIDLEIHTDHESRRRLLGQVSASGQDAPYAVRLRRSDDAQTLAETQTDEHGQFTLEAESGVYVLEIRLPVSMLVVPEFEVP